MYVIVDIDGTCANNAHRQPLLQQTPRDWDTFHDLCDLDTPHEHIRYVVWGLFWQGHTPVYVSGRMERSRLKTELWLSKHRFPSGPLYMRPENDHRDDTVIKTELAAKAGLSPSNVLLALDDRDRVVKMWREAGYKCLQVAEGDF